MILNIHTVRNQIPITNTRLKTYQNILWFISKKAKFSTNKTESMLEFKPETDIKEGIKKMVQWYKGEWDGIETFQ